VVSRALQRRVCGEPITVGSCWMKVMVLAIAIGMIEIVEPDMRNHSGLILAKRADVPSRGGCVPR
jgi:hypothetical protein